MRALRNASLCLITACFFFACADDTGKTTDAGLDADQVNDGSTFDGNPIGDGTADAPGDGTKPTVDGTKPTVDGTKPLEDGAKPGDGPKPTVDGTTAREGGWLPGDSGVVVVNEGGILITEDSGKQFACYETRCAGHLLKCGDCKDNDGDGLIDSRDPECLGPCDNTEGPALEPGVGGVGGNTCKVDCFFDFGNGPGNDNCVWDHRCDPLVPEPAICKYDASMLNTKKCPSTQSPLCAKTCLPYTPNGCDCFGCCTFPQLTGKGPGGKDAFVWIGAVDSKNVGTCTFKDVLDTGKCPRCTPVAGCYNPCGRCEVCLGKPMPPADCFAKPDAAVTPKDAGVTPKDGATPTKDGPTPTKDGATPTPDSSTTTPDSSTSSDGGVPTLQCPGGEQPCGLPGQANCNQGFYCISGCCIRLIIN